MRENRPCRLLMMLAVLAAGSCAGALALEARMGQQAPPTQPASVKPTLGTVKEVAGTTVTLTTDAGSEISVRIQDGARLLRIEPGEKDLRNATPLALDEIQVGDRILVRGKTAEDGKSVLATSVVAMKKTDIAAKQAHERDEWQKHGVGGLVNSVDAAAGTIVIATTGATANKTLAIHVSNSTVLRRYAAGSIQFDDAKIAPVGDIKAGDQLRARGTRNADGSELAASEIVSGAFRNIAGTISAVDPGAGTITVMDLAAKKPVVVRITGESQLRKLSQPMAQRIAMRLKGTPAEGAAPAAGQKPAEQAPAAPGGPGGTRGGATDLQQAISRLPPATLADLKNGDAVMIVTTVGGVGGEVTAITLLAGVEPILQASPKGGESILSPWSLSNGAGGEAPAP